MTTLNMLERYVDMRFQMLEQDRRQKVIRFYVNGVLGIAVSFFGLLGNLLSGMVLARRSMGRSSTYSYLTALAVVDFFFLLSTLFIHAPDSLLASSQSDSSIPLDPPNYYAYIFPYIHPLAYTLQVCSVWLTVAFTFDRYLMICHPFKANQYCNLEVSRKCISLLLFTCFIFNLPKLFEYETGFIDFKTSDATRKFNQNLFLLYNNRHNITLKNLIYQQLGYNKSLSTNHSDAYSDESTVFQHYSDSNLTNLSIETRLKFTFSTIAPTPTSSSLLTTTAPCSASKVIIRLSALGSHATFRGLYHLGLYLVFVSGLPFILLLYFNFRLISEVRRARRQARNMDIGTSERRRTDTTIMLIGVVIVFFICQIPALFSRVCYVYFEIYKSLDQPKLSALNELGNLLVVINSSINIIPYYLFGRRFREQFIRLLSQCFCCLCCRGSSKNRLSWS